MDISKFNGLNKKLDESADKLYAEIADKAASACSDAFLDSIDESLGRIETASEKIGSVSDNLVNCGKRVAEIQETLSSMNEVTQTIEKLKAVLTEANSFVSKDISEVQISTNKIKSLTDENAGNINKLSQEIILLSSLLSSTFEKSSKTTDSINNELGTIKDAISSCANSWNNSADIQNKKMNEFCQNIDGCIDRVRNSTNSYLEQLKSINIMLEEKNNNLSAELSTVKEQQKQLENRLVTTEKTTKTGIIIGSVISVIILILQIISFFI